MYVIFIILDQSYTTLTYLYTLFVQTEHLIPMTAPCPMQQHVLEIRMHFQMAEISLVGFEARNKRASGVKPGLVPHFTSANPSWSIVLHR